MAVLDYIRDLKNVEHSMVRDISTTSLNITNEEYSTLITGTSYADHITNYARQVTINSGAGDDYILNSD